MAIGRNTVLVLLVIILILLVVMPPAAPTKSIADKAKQSVTIFLQPFALGVLTMHMFACVIAIFR